MASFGSEVSLISTFLFIFMLLELFYAKRPFTLVENAPLRLATQHCWVVDKTKVGYYLQARDAPVPYQITFQDPATPSMEGIVDLHHEIMFYIIVIIVFVL